MAYPQPLYVDLMYTEKDKLAREILTKHCLPPKMKPRIQGPDSAPVDGSTAEMEPPPGWWPQPYGKAAEEQWPPHMQDLSQEQFFHQTGMHSPYVKDYRSHVRDPQPDDKHKYWSVTLYYLDHGSGIGHAYSAKRGGQGYEHKFFKFSACNHTWVTRNLGRGYNEYRCQHCGSNYTVDSSD